MSQRPARIVMATGNPGKIREIARLLGDLGIDVVAQSEFGVTDADETGMTFAENSLIKAQHAAAATGLPAIADDSGLSVDALDGAPGVYSARFAGPECDDGANNDKLLAELEGVEDRGAAFHCVATFVEPGGHAPLVAHGEWRGLILNAPQGDGGFGNPTNLHVGFRPRHINVVIARHLDGLSTMLCNGLLPIGLTLH